MYDLESLPDRIMDGYSSCSGIERRYLKKILEELSKWGESPTYNEIWLADYKEIPVSINTFLTDDTFLGKVTRNGSAIYPAWHEAMNDVFSAGNKFEEIVLTGATRIGKTSTAITMCAYMTYRLMCLKDPQAFFHKKDVSKFSITFFNITKDMAKGVAYREFNDTLAMSPWFCNHGTFSKSEQNFYYIPEGNKIIINYGSDAAHALGTQTFIGFMDECSFAKAGVKDVNKAKAHMKDLYDTVSARIKGTFRMNGEVYGKLFAISSKKSDSDFMENYVQTRLAAGNEEHMYIFDKPQWEVLPQSMFSEKRFHIAVGNKHQKGFVVPDEQENDEGLRAIESQGFKLLEVPIDMKTDFKSDFEIALRDLAGISVPGMLSFITSDLLMKSTVRSKLLGRKNPFTSTLISTGTRDRLTLEEFFDLSRVPMNLRKYPMYIHMDLSLNEDETGLGGVSITGRKDVEIGGKISSVLSFTHIFSVRIEAPIGANIAYDKIVKFIIWLRQNKFNIASISRDQYQSEYVGQQLESQGFKCDKISLDRTPDGYIAFRSALQENRIDMLYIEELNDELIHLQRDSYSGKIDHPVGGKKDMSDCVAGCVWHAMLDNPAIPVPTKSVASAIKAVATQKRPRLQKPGENLPVMNLGNFRKL